MEIIEPSLDIRESHSVTFECLVKGANPAPRITWLKDEFVYSQSLQYVSPNSVNSYSIISCQESEEETVVSALFLTLGREDNRAVLTCQAEVPGLPGHRQSSLSLDVKCRLSLWQLICLFSISFLRKYSFRLTHCFDHAWEPSEN